MAAKAAFIAVDDRHLIKARFTMSSIVIVNRYFWPETVLVNDIATWLVDAGHEVEVITSQPTYNPEARLPKRPTREMWNGITVRRLYLLPERGRGLVRQLNHLLFSCLTALLVLFGRKHRVVWTTSIPPVLQPLLLRVVTKLRGSQLIYFVQDIYPEIAILMGMIKRGALTGLITRLDNWTISRADVVVTLSSDMANSILKRGVVPRKLQQINNFSAIESTVKSSRPVVDGPCRFVFAGNIGRFQHLEQTVELFADIDPSEGRLELIGEGRLKQTLEEKVLRDGIKSVFFHPYQPAAEAFDMIRDRDVGIVSLTPGLYAYAYPSKTFTYLAAGVPLLCFIEKRSELARNIEEHGIGIAVDWSAPHAQLLEAIRHAIVTHRKMAQNLGEKRHDLCDRQAARARWTALFDQLLATDRRPI